MTSLRGDKELAQGFDKTSRSALRRYFLHRPKVWLASLEIAFLFVPLLWMGIAAKHLENRSIDLNEATRTLNNFSMLFEENVLRSVQEIDKTLRFLRSRLERTQQPLDYQALVRNTDIASDLLVQVAVIDEAGMLIASSARQPQLPNIDLSDREHFTVHRERDTDELFISKPVVGRASHKISVQMTRRVSKKDGSFGGVVVASFDPQYFNHLFKRVELGDGAVYALFGTDGVFRAVGGAARPGIEVGATHDWPRLQKELSGATSKVLWETFATPMTRDLIAVRKISGHPLVVCAHLPQDTVYAQSNYNLLVMSFTGIILSLITGFGAYRGRQSELHSRRRGMELVASHEALRASNVQLMDLNLKLQQSEAVARRQRGLFQSVFENSPDGLLTVDQYHRIVDANSTAQAMFGYRRDEFDELLLEALFAETTDFAAARASLASGQSRPATTSLRCVRKDGLSFPAQLSSAQLAGLPGFNLGFLIVIRDVTEQQRRESALVEKQRLEALGRLTGGIAHDFNNLLTVISGNLQLVGGEANPDKRNRYLAEAEMATVMGARLNQRLITFARQRHLAPETVNIDQMVGQLLDLIKRSVGEKIVVEADLAASPSLVCVDVSEMENAILNLVLNSRDAMDDGGSISITTRIIEITSSADAFHGELSLGNYVSLTVRDTGSGMSEDVAARACEPFFTTKSEGKGAGLGLTAIHGFIKQSGGHLSIESEIGCGTSVCIYLPMTANMEKRASLQSSEAPNHSGRGELILLVEDNSAVRIVTKERLSLLGYRVIEAVNGAEALKIASMGDPLDLVFSDIVMPGGVSGIELAKRLRRMRPELPILLTSGFPDEAARLEASETFPLAVLRKPYKNEELAQRIAYVLRAEKPVAG